MNSKKHKNDGEDDEDGSTIKRARVERPAGQGGPTWTQKQLRLLSGWSEEARQFRRDFCAANGWVCPITAEPFRSPVLLSDGVTYEESAVEQWMRQRAGEHKAPPTHGPTGIPLTQPILCPDKHNAPGAVSTDPTRHLLFAPNKPISTFMERGLDQQFASAFADNKMAAATRPLHNLRCAVSGEVFAQAVTLLSRKVVWVDDSRGGCGANAKQELPPCATLSLASMQAALDATWKQYSALAEQYVAGEAEWTSRNLSDTHVLVPNRLVDEVTQTLAPILAFVADEKHAGPQPKQDQKQEQKQDEKTAQEPRPQPQLQLPTRPPAPYFDESKLSRYTATRMCVNDQQLNGVDEVPRFAQFVSKDPALKDHFRKRVENAALHYGSFCFHGKAMEFANCLFRNCVFHDICWCGVRFTACHFDNCTFVKCARKQAPLHHMLNNTYHKCALSNCDDDFAELLTGVQTAPEQ